MVKKFFNKFFSKEKTDVLNEENMPKTPLNEQKLNEIDFAQTKEDKAINLANESTHSNLIIDHENQILLDDMVIETLIRKRKTSKKLKAEKNNLIKNDNKIHNLTIERDQNVEQSKGNFIETTKAIKIEKPEKHYEGHRERLRNKVIENGPTNLKDYELLELLLTYSIPRADVKPLAKTLLANFKSLQNLFLSDAQKKISIAGIGQSTICFLSVIHEICCRIAKEEIIDQVLLDTPEKVINYCRLRMSGLDYEQFKVLFLNRKNKLIIDETIQSGTIDKAAIFPRELIKRAIELAAGAIILVHNHPSGEPTPSEADIELTANIQKAASLMEILLYDHIIIGKNKHYSMRSNQLIT